MENISRLFWEFWSKFGDAYQIGYVPVGAAFPYLTYEVARPRFGEQTVIGVNIFDQSTSFTRIRAIGAAIEEAIPHGGVVLNLPGGSVWLARGTPFIQSRTLPADEVKANIKADYVSVIVRSFIN